MNRESRFSLFQSKRFHKLIKKLEENKIVRLKNRHNTKKVTIEKRDVLLEILTVVFIAYVTPNDKIAFDSPTKRIIVKGQFIDIAINKGVSAEAFDIIKILLTKEEKGDYESAFNSILAVYLGSLEYLKAIYPNTFIRELGKNTHELDICLETWDNKYVTIETTRGFDENEGHSWHFKKSIFRKWAIEKLYETKCLLCYITLKNLTFEENLSDLDILPGDMATEESENTEISTKSLIEKLLNYEEETLKILDLGNYVKTALTFEEIQQVLQKHLIDDLTKIFTDFIGSSPDS